MHAGGLLRPCFAVFVALGAGCNGGNDPNDGLERVKIGDATFHLEVAADHATRVQGLSDRTEIAADGGMLFVFGQQRVINMVMRRCFVPIDVIFLDRHGRVIVAHRMAVEPDPHALDRELNRYSSGDPAAFAIELAGGSLDRLDVKIGDPLPLDVARLRGLVGSDH